MYDVRVFKMSTVGMFQDRKLERMSSLKMFLQETGAVSKGQAVKDALWAPATGGFMEGVEQT
jgi:hypothetical protein